MPAHRRITSARNGWVREVAALKERRARDRTGTMLVEGAREVQRALAAGLQPRSLILASPASDEVRRRLSASAAAHDAEIVDLSPEAFDRISLREHSDGVAAVFPTIAREPTQLRLPADPWILVLDGIEKPGNVGALLRTADAVGVDAVLVTGAGTDLGNPNVVRASMGSVFAIELATASAEHARRWLAAHGIRIIASSPHAERPHWNASYAGATALVVGSEHAGLPAAWLAVADETVAIPMRSTLADSLNVGVAGAVLLYEALRQRSLGTEAVVERGR